MNEVIYLAGGCLWGVQAFVKTLPGVVETEAGRANGSTHDLDGQYDGYVECVKTIFDSNKVSAKDLIGHLFEIIDPYSSNQQGEDIGPKYRTGVYSEQASHLEEAKEYIQDRSDRIRVVVEVLPLTNFVPSAEEHQDRLDKYPDDYCHIPKKLLQKYNA
ncbi:peptide-methionine (S)-S-oxide reductase [Staphylococcus carnosus]|uniref:peptide-methionine (S)-S-oxide reductase n=1 Tax=Staphylococcus carnosus TaxID=1281 RepID=UPI0020A5AF0E|nr:peptide-methionine (S)-S-oxide reductase [Staphylococcus carnosus]UTB79629.1 methionine sulfoxide reductase A [Staphylococcus carnosus]